MSQEMPDGKCVTGARHKFRLGLPTHYSRGGGEMQQDYWKSVVAVTLFVSVAATLGTGCKAKEAKTVRL